jgi:uncharacterized repeat protein (TIGR03833 family)
MVKSNINNLVISIFENNSHFSRSNIKKGSEVLIVLKEHQRTEYLTHGIVKDLLTSKVRHTRGIKVRLEDGQVGRVQKILTSPLKKITFPKEEHKDILNHLKNNNILYTVRVDKQYSKYNENDILISDINYYFEVEEVTKLTNIKNYKFYKDLDINQINLLKNYNKIDILKLSKLGIK